MKCIFEIIRDLPYCSNCGESDWKKGKNGELYCVYCGHPMIREKDCEKIEFKMKVKRALEKRK